MNNQSNSRKVIPARIVNLVQEIHRCYGYDLSRQFIISCAVLLEGILIEIHSENDTDIIGIIKSESEQKVKDDNVSKKKGKSGKKVLSKFATLGRILYHPKTRELLTPELLEICERLKGLRTAGAHYSLIPPDKTDADYVYEIIRDFAIYLIEAHKDKPDYIRGHWGDLIKIIDEKKEERYIAEVGNFVCSRHTDSRGTWLDIFRKILYYMPYETRAIFGLVQKHYPERLYDIYAFSDKLSISREVVNAAMVQLNDLEFFSKGSIPGDKSSNYRIRYNQSLHSQARRYCSLFWNEVLGKYYEFDPEPPTYGR